MSASGKKKTKPKGKKVSARKSAKPKVTKTKKVVKPAVEEEEEKPKKVAPKAKEQEKKEVPHKAAAKVERIKFGPAPTAMVEVRHIDSTQERAARGFSFGELSSAGVPLNAAKREGLSLDIRRRSVVGGNVEMLKGWLKSSGSPAQHKAEEPAAVSKKK